MNDKRMKVRRVRSSGKRRSGEAAANTLAARVATILREEIIAGRIASGEKIVEQATALRLGVSRVPIREATILLEREGLLVRSPTGRRRVRTLEPRDLVEIAELRLLIEPRLAALAAERHTAADVAAIERNMADLATAETEARIAVLDDEFHDLIAVAAHHARLAYLWEMTRGQMLLLIAALQRREPLSVREMRQGTVANHRSLWALIQSRDAVGAARKAEETDRDVLALARAKVEAVSPEVGLLV